MKIVVLAQENDNHTAPIKWALEHAGYEVACWAGLSWTPEQQASLTLKEQTSVHLGLHTLDSGDVVWIRRPEPPVYNPRVSEADKKFAEKEYREFNQSIFYLLETLPVWVINRYSASRFIKNKAVQLQLARSCGLKTPDALMSNAPHAVRQFMGLQGGRIVCKGFTPHMWQRQDQRNVAVSETFELKRDELPRDEVLTYAPCIYQDMIVKQFDARVVLMGHRIYSFALHNPKNALDWRQDAGQGQIAVEIIATPPEVEKGILAFASRAGICFGSVDFAVDTNGQWWFLEINEQGQFLWLDSFNPDVRLQEKFCAFITAPEGSTDPLEKREALFPSFAEFGRWVEQQPVPPLPAPVPGSPYLSIEP